MPNFFFLPPARRLLSLLAALLVAQGAAGQAGHDTRAGQPLPGLPFWKWQNPTPQHYILNDLHAFTDSAALLVGDHGTALRTADQGRTWTAVNVGTDRDLVSVAFATPQVGWVAYSTPATNFNTQTGGVGPGEIRRTTNGGQTWTRQPIGESYSVRMRKLVPVTATTLFVWYDWARRYANGFYGNFAPRLRRSTNGGAAWTAVAIPLPADAAFGDVVFPSATTGFVGGEAGFFSPVGFLLRTTDGGNTWADIAPDSGRLRVKSLCFLDDQRGWVAGARKTADGGPTLLYTANAGTTWQPLALPATAGAVNVVDVVRFAPDGQHGIVQTNGADYYRTADGGLTWTLSGAGTITWSLVRPPIVRLAPSGVTWAQTANVALSVAPSFTDPLRPTYQPRAFATDRFTNVQFPDPGVGWIGPGAQFIDFNGQSSWWVPGGTSVLRTTDRGDHWRVLALDSLTAGLVTWPTPTNGVLSFISTTAFPDRDTAYAAGVENDNSRPLRRAFMVRTTDGGRTWTRLPLPASPQAPIGMSFLDGRRGLIVGDSGLTMVTHDAGLTWEQPVIGRGRHRLYAAGWIDAQHLYAGGDSVNVAHSADGGRTWSVTPQDSSGILAPGYTAASYQPSPGRTRNLYFTTPTRGYQAGGNTVSRTLTGGNAWWYGLFWFTPPGAPNLYIQGGRTSALNQVVFRTPQEGYAFGNDQFRTLDGGFTWTVWAQTTTPTQAGALVDRYNAYAVGDEGTIIRYSEKLIRTDTALARTAFCLGAGPDSLAVPFTTEGAFGPAEQDFRVELSNAKGRFRPGQTTLVGRGTASPLLAHLPAALAPGTYRLRVIRADSTVLGTDNGVDLLVSRRPAAVATSPADSVAICAGDSVQLTAPAGYAAYQWSTGATTPAVWVRAAGAYAVQVGAAADCLSPISDSVRVRVKPVPAAPTITAAPQGSGIVVLTSSSPVGNQWLFNGAPIGGATGITYAVTTAGQSGSYTVQVTLGGCPGPASAAQPVSVAGVGAEAVAAGLALAPNPATGSVRVTLAGGRATGVVLTDLTGRVVLTVPGKGAPEVVLPLGGLPAGTYLVRVRCADGRALTRRLVVQP